MDISFNCGLNKSFIENNKDAHNDSFDFEDDILNEHYPLYNFFVLNSKTNNQNPYLIKDNGNPFFYD